MKRLRTFVLCCCLFLLPASAAAEALVGLYGVPASPAKERTAASATLHDAGANAVFVSADGDAIRHYRKLGFRVFVALNVFGGSGGWKKYPDARPVKADGRLLGTAPEDKGQEGMCPSHAGWRRDRIGRIESVAKRFGTEIDGIFLDYVRYPGFWEKPSPNLPDTCYCARCLSKFLADTKIRIADRRAFDAAPAAWIAKNRPYEWMKWKKGQIASFVREAKGAMQAAVIARSPKVDTAISAAPGSGKPVTSASSSVTPASYSVTPASYSVTPASYSVTPAKAGVQRPGYAPPAGKNPKTLDSRFRGNDKMGSGNDRMQSRNDEDKKSSVVLANAGTQRPDYAQGAAGKDPGHWIPASAGMTEEKTEMAGKGLDSRFRGNDRKESGNDRPLLGLFVVPWTKGERNGDVSYRLGQDAAFLSEFADVLSPMVYHRMCGEAPAWVEETTTYFRESASCPVWPIVQSADADTGEFAEALRAAAAGGADGVLVFHYGGMQKAEDPAAMWKALAAFAPPRNLIPNPELRLPAGAHTPEGWRFGPSEKTLDSHSRGNDKVDEHSGAHASSSVTPAPYSVVLANAGTQRLGYSPYAAGKDSGHWIPASAGMTEEKTGVTDGKTGVTEKGLDSRFRGNDGREAGNGRMESRNDKERIWDGREKGRNDRNATAGMIRSAAELDVKMARFPHANAAGVTGSRDGFGAWSAEIPACRPGEEYLFTGFFYREHWDNISYPKVSAWGETFELDNHVFFIKSFQPLRAHIPCPPAPAETLFRFVNDAPGETFWMAKPSLVRKEASARGDDAAERPQLLSGFFPIGIWGANRGNLEQIRSLGINTVLLRDEGEELRRAIRRCRELALRFVLSVPSEPERLRVYLDGLADLKLGEHEAAFYVEDEPELRSVPVGRTMDIRRMLRDRFPKIAACMAIVRPQACRDYLDAADFFMMDQYPVPFRPMTLLSDSMDRAAQDAGRERLLSVVQAFGGGDEAAVGRTRWPTWEEMDCLAFLSVIHGSRGVFFFSFSDMGRNEDGRERLGRVAGRLNAVYPWLGVPNEKAPVGVTMLSDWRVDPKGRPAVQAALKAKDGERLLIAVNTIGHRVEAKLALPVDAEANSTTLDSRFRGNDGRENGNDKEKSGNDKVDEHSGAHASSSVTPTPSSVVLANAGTQRPDYSPDSADKNPGHWIPASVGMTEEKAGVTDGKTGVTEKGLDSRFRGNNKREVGNDRRRNGNDRRENGVDKREDGIDKRSGNDRKGGNDGKNDRIGTEAEEVFGSGAYPLRDGTIRASFAPFETKAFLIRAPGKQ